MIDASQIRPDSDSMVAILLRHRFVVLLAGLILLMATAPLARLLTDRETSSALIAVVFVIMLLANVIAVSTTRRRAAVAVALTVPAMVLPFVFMMFPHDALARAKDVAGGLAVAYVVVALLNYLFRSGHVNFNTIAASLCIYLLLGVLWAVVYSLLDASLPGSFHFAYAEEERALRFGGERTEIALYYSFVTMTTLGYGDIVPANGPARMLGALQAIVGQMYLAVLVARLVGMHIAQSSIEHDPDGG